ncbi:uncharacterized protein STEHIDRAFT_60036, partial [Stereum hirsutum FP-91666 SS1]|uniref:uncharacterized protein n=1 Tax=Stereum hirsutum (strain FP-91666) TaxID=721885 RepID=UPI000444924C
MIGCNFLLEISEALSAAKGNSSAFGNISIILAGDFAQLPPVGEKRLYSRLDTRSVAQGGTQRGQKAIFGKLLWLSFNTVVVLDQIMRQGGNENIRFVQLLARLREDIDATAEEWNGVPIIVSNNAVKDALNVKATIAFAQRTGKALHWYYSTD